MGCPAWLQFYIPFLFSSDFDSYVAFNHSLISDMDFSKWNTWVAYMYYLVLLFSGSWCSHYNCCVIKSDELFFIPLITWSLSSIGHGCWHGCTCLPTWNIPLPWLLWLTALSYSLLLWLLFLGILPKLTLALIRSLNLWSQILSLLFFSLYCNSLDELVTWLSWILSNLQFSPTKP